MKRSVVTAALVLAIGCGASAPASVEPLHEGAMQQVNVVIDGIKSGNPSALSALYAANAVIVDDQRPFEWTGARAGVDWLSDAGAYSEWSRSVARFTAQPVEVETAGANDAYVVAAAQLSSVDPKRPWTQRGTLTFTLHKTNGAWKITSQMWTRSVARAK